VSLAVKLMLSPVLVAQAVLTRSRLPKLPEPDGARLGHVDHSHGMAEASGAAGAARGRRSTRAAPRPPLELLIAGDSSAAGVGVATQRDALAMQLGARLAERLQHPVRWALHAKSGLTTAQTLELLRSQGLPQGQVALVVTGVNDVIDQVPSHRAVDSRAALANFLRNGCGVQHVVFAPLPPIHEFPGLPQPLRWVAGADALRHNAALREWATTRSDVSCVDMQMPLNAGVMAEDGFHPGLPVYRYCALTIAEHIGEQVWPLLHLGA
jgi:lysophospholipase L1-like esterase